MGFSSRILQRLAPRCLPVTQLLPSAPWQLQPGLIVLLANLGTALTPAHVRGIEGSDSHPRLHSPLPDLPGNGTSAVSNGLIGPVSHAAAGPTGRPLHQVSKDIPDMLQVVVTVLLWSQGIPLQQHPPLLSYHHRLIVSILSPHWIPPLSFCPEIKSAFFLVTVYAQWSSLLLGAWGPKEPLPGGVEGGKGLPTQLGGGCLASSRRASNTGSLLGSMLMPADCQAGPPLFLIHRSISAL